MENGERTHSSISENPSNQIREEAFQKLKNNQISVEEYVTFINNHPLMFTSATRPVPILKREGGGIRIVGSELKNVELKQ